MTFLRLGQGRPRSDNRATKDPLLQCKCGSRITDKQKHQQAGCCDKCFAAKKVAP